MNNTKIILISLVAIILASFVYLSYQETNQSHLSGWWTLSFTDPKSDLLNFKIENYTNNKNFHYTVLDGEKKVLEKDITIDKNTKKEIYLDSEISKNDKILIRVSNETESKEIYIK